MENPGDGGAWWAALYGVTQSRTRLKRLSGGGGGGGGGGHSVNVSCCNDNPCCHLSRCLRSSSPAATVKMGTSLVVQRLRIFLQMQAIWVQSLVRRTKIPHASGELSLWAATKTQCSQKEKKKKKKLAWRIPGTGEPGGLPAMESHRVGQD